MPNLQLNRTPKTVRAVMDVPSIGGIVKGTEHDVIWIHEKRYDDGETAIIFGIDCGEARGIIEAHPAWFTVVEYK